MKTSGKKTRILIAGGGTGGHLFPGVAIAESFQEKINCTVRFVGTQRGLESKVLPQQGFYLYTIPVAGLYRVGFKKKILSLLKLPLACIKSILILCTYRPHLVIGVGGYASGPILALAILFRKKVIIQEQNAFPGLTNRILGKYVPLAFVPFSGLEKIFKNPVIVGNPIRRLIRNAAKAEDPRKKSCFVISIIGGSQGAHIINQTFLETLSLLQNEFAKLTIFHQTGTGDFNKVEERYKGYPDLKAEAFPFSDSIDQIMLKSNLLICRAGSVVNEIIAMGRASILIPIKFSSGNHQLANAKKLENSNAAICIEETILTAELLQKIIKDLINNPSKVTAMEQNASAMGGDCNAEQMIVQRTLDYYAL